MSEIKVGFFESLEKVRKQAWDEAIQMVKITMDESHNKIVMEDVSPTFVRDFLVEQMEKRRDKK